MDWLDLNTIILW